MLMKFLAESLEKGPVQDYLILQGSVSFIVLDYFASLGKLKLTVGG